MNDQLLRMVPDQVRVVISNAENGDEMAGVMPTKEALDKARELGEWCAGEHAGHQLSTIAVVTHCAAARRGVRVPTAPPTTVKGGRQQRQPLDP